MPDLYDLERQYRSVSLDLKDAEARRDEAYRRVIANPVTPESADAYRRARRRANALVQPYEEAKARLEKVEADVAYWRDRADHYRRRAQSRRFWTGSTGLTITCGIEIGVLTLFSLAVLLLKVPVAVWAIGLLLVAMGAVSVTALLFSVRRQSVRPELERLESETEAAERAASAAGGERQTADEVMARARAEWERADVAHRAAAYRARPLMLYEESADELAAARERFDRVRARYDEVQAGRRLRLLNERWEYLKDREFERFIREVFECLGYRTEMTPRTGDQGIDVVAEKGGVRWGIQCKGYSSPLGNKPVQEAVAGREFHRCDRCMVIATTTFTRGGRALAEVNDCVLVEAREIPALIRGELHFETSHSSRR